MGQRCYETGLFRARQSLFRPKYTRFSVGAVRQGVKPRLLAFLPTICLISTIPLSLHIYLALVPPRRLSSFPILLCTSLSTNPSLSLTRSSSFSGSLRSPASPLSPYLFNLALPVALPLSLSHSHSLYFALSVYVPLSLPLHPHPSISPSPSLYAYLLHT